MKILLAYEHIRRLTGTHGEWVCAIGNALVSKGHEVEVICDSVANPSQYPALRFHARRPFVRGDSHRLALLRNWARHKMRTIDHDVSISFDPSFAADYVAPIRGWVQTRLKREMRFHRNPLWNTCLHLHPPVNDRKWNELQCRRTQSKSGGQYLAFSRVMADALAEPYAQVRKNLVTIPGASPIMPADSAVDRAMMRAECRRMLGVSDEQVVFLWASKRATWHGSRYAIDAFARATAGIPHADKAVLVLAAEGQYRLHRQVAQRDCLSQVRIISRTDEMRSILEACDVGLDPAILSHLGRFTWECLAFGKPVITTSLTAGVDRLKTDDQRQAGRIARPYDVPSIRQAIEDMLDRSLREATTLLAESIAPSMRFGLFVDRLEAQLMGATKPTVKEQHLTGHLEQARERVTLQTQSVVESTPSISAAADEPQPVAEPSTHQGTES